MTAQAEPLPRSSAAPPHPLREFWFYFSQNAGAVLGLVTILIILLLALSADYITAQSPVEIHNDAFLRPPFWEDGG